MFVRGIRGATTVKNNNKEEILVATQELLSQIVAANELSVEAIASIVFTTTPGLTAEFPAQAARLLGWHDTPLLCATEIAVPQGLKNCIRVLLHVNTDKKPPEIKHIYLKEAVILRS